MGPEDEQRGVHDECRLEIERLLVEVEQLRAKVEEGQRLVRRWTEMHDDAKAAYEKYQAERDEARAERDALRVGLDSAQMVKTAAEEAELLALADLDEARAAVLGLHQSEADLRNLLAVVHRDGGHYTDRVGIERSHLDAGQKAVELLVCADECATLRAEVERTSLLLGIETEKVVAAMAALKLTMGQRDHELARAEEAETAAAHAVAEHHALGVRLNQRGAELERVRGELDETRAIRESLRQQRDIVAKERDAIRTDRNRLPKAVSEHLAKCFPERRALRTECSDLRDDRDKAWSIVRLIDSARGPGGERVAHVAFLRSYAEKAEAELERVRGERDTYQWDAKIYRLAMQRLEGERNAAIAERDGVTK